MKDSLVQSKLKASIVALLMGLGLLGSGCGSEKENDEEIKENVDLVAATADDEIKEAPKPTTKNENDPYGNVALFEKKRSKTKFALAIVENYYPFIYSDGENWTTGCGLTVLYDKNGVGHSVTKKTKVPNISESDKYVGRYLTFEVLPDVKNLIKVPIDDDLLVTFCVFRYCTGGSYDFRHSNFIKAINSGMSRKEISRRITGFRTPKGILKRMYFFAAILEGKIAFEDLLDLRAEGCYNLELNEVCECTRKQDPKTKKWYWDPVIDKDGYATWKFDNIDKKLAKAKNPRSTPLTVWNAEEGKKQTKRVPCLLAKDIVMDYIWEEVSNGKPDVTPEKTTPASDEQNEPKKEINRKEARKIHDDAVAKSNAGDVNGALEMLLPLAETRYDNASLENDISYLSFKNGEYDIAKDAAQKALEMSVKRTDSAAAYYNLGCACAEKYELFQAKESFEKSLELQATEQGKASVQKELDSVNDLIKKFGWALGGIAGLGLLGAGIAVHRRKKQYSK